MGKPPYHNIIFNIGSYHIVGFCVHILFPVISGVMMGFTSAVVHDVEREDRVELTGFSVSGNVGMREDEHDIQLLLLGAATSPLVT
jgi:hypothetical protein